MYKLSEIIGKSVIGTFEAKNVGTLMNALFDRSLTKIRWFEVLSDDETDAGLISSRRRCRLWTATR